MLEEWREIFDEAEFIVKPYEKYAFEGNLIADFYKNVLGIDTYEVRQFEKIDRSQGNHRLDRDILEYKKCLDIRNDKVNQLLIQYCENLGKIEDYAYFNKLERMKFMKVYCEQNTLVAKKYLHRENGRLFMDADYDVPLYEGLKLDRVCAITRWLINELI